MTQLYVSVHTHLRLTACILLNEVIVSAFFLVGGNNFTIKYGCLPSLYQDVRNQLHINSRG